LGFFAAGFLVSLGIVKGGVRNLFRVSIEVLFRTLTGWRRLRVALCLPLVVLLCFSTAVAAEPPIPQDSGSAGLQQALRKLRTTARLMHTTAHPDDEDGGMLVIETRARGATALQLTLTRGEGGQNATGGEFGDALGFLRTLELLAADNYYDVEQRFTRVADFGFSKSPEETFQKWQGRDVALADMVRVIRTFRPDVIITRFQGAARDNHGHHQAAGILTREAFRAAADPNRFPEQLREGLQPWQAKKLYMDNVRSGEDWNVKLDRGAEDPELGMSYIQFAMQGLHHQLSQGAGHWSAPTGPSFSYYKLIDSVLPPPKEPHERDFFEGIDTSLPALATRLGADQAKAPFLPSALTQIAADAAQAETASHAGADVAVPLLEGLRRLNELLSRIDTSPLTGIEKADLNANLQTKQEEFERAINIVLGARLTAFADLPDLKLASTAQQQNSLTAVPGGAFTLRVKLSSQSSLPIRDIQLLLPPGWKFRKLAPGNSGEVRFEVTVPAEAPYTRQYWHRDSPSDAVYVIDNPRYATLPLTPAPAQVRVRYEYKGRAGTIESIVQVELPQPHLLAVGPAVSVAVEPPTQIIPAAGQSTASLEVNASSNVASARPVISAALPPGWKLEPADNTADLSPLGESRNVKFSLLPANSSPNPASKDGIYQVRAVATLRNRTYSEGYETVSRSDLTTAYFFRPAVQTVSVVNVKLPRNLKVGYIPGAGDDIPTVLKQIGMDVSLITPEELAQGDLNRFGTIVVGIRAYDTRPDVCAHNSRLLDFVSGGGTLIVQYNQSASEFNAGHFTPYPGEVARDRVTVEEAPVELLAPSDSIFHFPNQISSRDFDGWVQERGLYFMHQWDSHFQPLLASHDPGEAPLQGGLLRARYGKGLYIYSGYAFFRQLPAGVPGAIRLFVNLLSAGHESSAAAYASADE